MLGCMQKRLGVLLREFNDLYKQYSQAEANSDINDQGRDLKRRYEKEFSLFLDNLMDVLFYLYQCDSRMSTSVKTVAIISQLQRFVRGKFKFENGSWSEKFLPKMVQALDEKITDLTRRLYIDMPDDPTILMEHLNMLELQKCMIPATQLHPSVLIDKFVGNELVLGVGKEGEPYEGIGRGPLNIAGLPVYRDAQGGVGTPTSDHERTKMTLQTTHLVVLINGYDGDEERVKANAQYIQQLLIDYAQSDGGTVTIYRGS